MAASPLSQCAEMTSIAAGLPSSLPRSARNSRAALRSMGNVGAPCETKIAGNRSAIAPTHPLGNQHRFGLAFTFHDNIPNHLYASFNPLKVFQREAGAQARANLYRRGEAQSVESIIDTHFGFAKLERLIEEMAQQRHCQKPVGDRRSERRFTPCAFNVDMDPLMISCRVRELLNAILCDFEPVAYNDFHADFACQVIQAVEHCSRHPRPLWAAMYRIQGTRALRVAIRAGTMIPR